MSNRFYIVDVFADRAYSGNPLAVVVCDSPLPCETMQQVAAEMNFSETIFVAVQPDVAAAYGVRIFTPAREIEFAGHPILGAAWIIHHHLAAVPSNVIQLNIATATITVRIETDAGGRQLLWFRAPPMRLGRTVPVAAVAESVGLMASDVEAALPIQVVSAGTAAMVIPVRTLDALYRSQIDLSCYKQLTGRGYPPLMYLFTRSAFDPEKDVSARFFFEANGVREDPATGNGAAFLAAYMLQHLVPPGERVELRIDQGRTMSRPSEIRLRMRSHEGRQDVEVGGSVVPVVEGRLL